MTLPPLLVAEAKADVMDAYLWYEDQSLGLGMEFVRCVEAALLLIQRTPLIHPVVHETYCKNWNAKPARVFPCVQRVVFTTL